MTRRLPTFLALAWLLAAPAVTLAADAFQAVIDSPHNLIARSDLPTGQSVCFACHAEGPAYRGHGLPPVESPETVSPLPSLDTAPRPATDAQTGPLWQNGAPSFAVSGGEQAVKPRGHVVGLPRLPRRRPRRGGPPAWNTASANLRSPLQHALSPARQRSVPPGPSDRHPVPVLVDPRSWRRRHGPSDGTDVGAVGDPPGRLDRRSLRAANGADVEGHGALRQLPQPARQRERTLSPSARSRSLSDLPQPLRLLGACP
jgi:hypothetical protein